MVRRQIEQREWKEEVPISYDKDAIQREEATFVRWDKPPTWLQRGFKKFWNRQARKIDLWDHANVKEMKQLTKIFDNLLNNNKELFLHDPS